MSNRQAKQALRRIQHKQKGVWKRAETPAPPNVSFNIEKLLVHLQNQPKPPETEKEKNSRPELASTQISRDVNNYHYDFEKVNRMTPTEMQYYLGIIFPNGYAVCEIPENCVQGLVIPR